MAILVFKLGVNEPKKNTQISAVASSTTLAAAIGAGKIAVLIDDTKVTDPQYAQNLPINSAIEQLDDKSLEFSRETTVIGTGKAIAFHTSRSMPSGHVTKVNIADITTGTLADALGTDEIAVVLCDPGVSTTGLMYTCTERLEEFILAWGK